jgi:hypothetical protein
MMMEEPKPTEEATRLEENPSVKPNEESSEGVLLVNSVPSNARKRRNRWGEANDTTNDSSASTNSQDLATTNESSTVDNSVASVSTIESAEETARKAARRSRWSAEVIPSTNGSSSASVINPIVSTEIIQQTVVLQLQLAQLNQSLMTVVQDAARIEQDPNRSPSPPPRYDSSGKRINTREFRMREALNQQRIKLIEELVKFNPAFQPPIDFIKTKPFRKIYVPKTNDPNINYIGLIIGPRGRTQKQMEQETNTRISIRGKGSANDKKRGQKQPDEDDELHVHIQAENEEGLDRAAKMVEALLRPLDDKLNEHKQKQLKELALINGTWKEENDYCPICGEKGHQQFDCPYRAKAFKAAGVKCSICGDLSHPTRDCPMREQGISSANDNKNLDNEYDSFLAELDDPKAGPGQGGSGEGKEKGQGGGGNGSSSSYPLPKKGYGPVEVTPIVDMVSRNPSSAMDMMSILGSKSTDTMSYQPPQQQQPITAVPAPVAPIAAPYDPYSTVYASSDPYAAYYASAGYDPNAYAAYVAAYNSYMSATPMPPPPPTASSNPPPPPPN